MSLIALLFVVSQSPFGPPPVETAFTAWSFCVAERRLDLASGTGTPDSINDAAFAACTRQEVSMFRALRQAYGPARARAMLAQHRAQSRELGLEAIRQARGGRPVTDPEFIWGQCVGTRVRGLAAGAGAPDAIVDAAYASCTAQERAVLRHVERLLGPEQAIAYTSSLRRAMRGHLTEAIVEIRAGRR